MLVLQTNPPKPTKHVYGGKTKQQIARQRNPTKYGYDANGNFISATDGEETQVSYDYFNKPTLIEKNGNHAYFKYDPSGKRYFQSDERGGNNLREIVYIDKLYEKTPAGAHKLYIGDYAVFDVGGATQGLKFLHKDRLGSIVAVSYDDGTMETSAYRSFDPFGKPLEENLTERQAFENDLAGELLTTRGFTGHEHLNGVSLIHMNGRAYDYNLGRFLSVDPFIQFPANSQSLNPYSYLMNNPMSGTDPTGYTCDAQSDDQCAKETGASDKSSRSSAQRGMAGNWITVFQRQGPSGMVDNGAQNGQSGSQSGSEAGGPSSISDIGSAQQPGQSQTGPSNIEEVIVTASAIAGVTRPGMTTFPAGQYWKRFSGSLGRPISWIKPTSTSFPTAIGLGALIYPSPISNCINGICMDERPLDSSLMPGADIEAIRNASGPLSVYNEFPEVSWTDPSVPPKSADGTEWVWVGPDDPGGKRGAWVNPKDRKESVHPDLDHAPPIGPHYDHNRRKGKGHRVYPDGRREPKK